MWGRLAGTLREALAAEAVGVLQICEFKAQRVLCTVMGDTSLDHNSNS